MKKLAVLATLASVLTCTAAFAHNAPNKPHNYVYVNQWNNSFEESDPWKSEKQLVNEAQSHLKNHKWAKGLRLTYLGRTKCVRTETRIAEKYKCSTIYSAKK